MSSTGGRRRGGSFHVDDDDVQGGDSVQFMTPYYEGGSDGPEPLDLSKICLDDPNMYGKENHDDNEEEEQFYSRGRSRSRSVHENDSVVPVNPVTIGANDSQGINHGTAVDDYGNHPDGPKHNNDLIERTGPLQHREVLALKKGLEEAVHSINRDQSREDEEERMAADAEKRKRLLLSSRNHSNPTAAGGASDAAATRRGKILMLGDSGVGKSSLILRWTLDTFSPSLTSTVGVNFKTRKVTVRDEVMQVQVWDTAGQEQFHKITTSYYKGAHGIMLVYDVSDAKSLENVEYWIKNIKSHASDTVQVALIGNKCDLRGLAGDNSKNNNNNNNSSNSSSNNNNSNSASASVKSTASSNSTGPPLVCVDYERGEEVAMKFGIPFFETSAKESDNVDLAFLTLSELIMDSLSQQQACAHGGGVGGGTQAGLDRRNQFPQHHHHNSHYGSNSSNLSAAGAGSAAAANASDASGLNNGKSSNNKGKFGILSKGDGKKKGNSKLSSFRKQQQQQQEKKNTGTLRKTSSKDSNDSTSTASDTSTNSCSATLQDGKEKCTIS